jgi:hypothetical protein
VFDLFTPLYGHVNLGTVIRLDTNDERGEPSEESLRELFALIQRYPFWTEDGGLSEDSVRFMIDMATESGVLTQPMNAADVVDRAALNRAVELANQPL